MDEGDIVAYLRRIGADRTATLSQLHVAHLCAVPFENLSIHWREPIHFDPELLFAKIVGGRRGGFCYELNGLFAELLLALGYRVERLAARVFSDDGRLGIPFDHMCLRVDGAWLVDVGFGDSFIAPLRLDALGEQSDGRRTFRVVAEGANTFKLLDAGCPSYCFELVAHPISDFAPGCAYHTTSPESPFTRGTVVSRLTADGRITLRDDRWIETIAGQKREHPIDRGEWESILADRFGITAVACADQRRGPPC